MNKVDFDALVNRWRTGSDAAVAAIIREAYRARQLAQCCTKDDDFDGNCNFHERRVAVPRERKAQSTNDD